MLMIKLKIKSLVPSLDELINGQTFLIIDQIFMIFWSNFRLIKIHFHNKLNG